MAAKSIIITGAGSGIGRETAQLFLSKGWRVGLVGRREEALAETAGTHDNVLILQGDVSDPAAVEAIFARAMEAWGHLDAVFNNAGVSLPGTSIDELSYEDWRALMAVNVDGAFLVAQAAFKAMRAQDPQGGRIINNGSISAHMPRPGSVGYTMSKHAITGLTRTLSLDGRAFNIACGQIDIGNALTAMAQQMTVGMPQADGSVRAEAVMDAAHVASSVLHMAELPLSANVQFMTVMASAMPYIGRG